MDAAQRSVLELLGDRVLDDENLPEQVAELVLAAFEGEQQLGAAIRGEPAAHATERPACGGTAPEVYLGAIHAEGFRGVGPAAVLRLQPGPGLTLVTGRNGSGKSSFAEAAELVLTGANKRWSGRTSVWREGWRNLHNDGSAMIAVDLVTAGEPGVLTLRRDWAVDDDLDAGTSTMQRAGEKRLPLSAPEWTAALETYRPFLSYSELGALIDGKPSELYDALYRLLGLDALTEAQKTLRDQHKRLQDAARRMQESRRALAVDLAEVDDERARRAATLLARQRADLTAIANLALGSDRDATELTALRAIATMRMPDGEAVTAATTRLRQSIAAAAESSTETAATASSTAELLRAAMRHRDGHDETCPVCRIGMLDERWQAEAERRAGELERAATRLRTAAADVATALASAKGLVTTTPQALRHAPAGLDITGAHELWQRWEATLAVTEPAAVADALDAVFAELAPVVAETIRAAEDELARRNETWQPLARRLATWHDDAEKVRAADDTRLALKQAEQWLKGAAADLRNERLAPFAEHSARIWRRLRQQSSVELGPVQLAGNTTQRHVALDVTVDGVAGTALGVMSQGELHALALALFLPRATAEESPFRFLLIDDPVQAMDPAKVDGLARVLAEVATSRQVVVLTHDDRLAEAVRRLRLEATIWEVCRGERSTVELRRSDNPVSRYLGDAWALASSPKLPVELRGELVASCCRGALEAAAQAKVRAVRLGRGESHNEVEAALRAARTTHNKLTLAEFDDPGRGKELYPRLNRLGHWAVDTVRECKEGAHIGGNADLRALITNTGKLAERLLP